MVVDLKHFKPGVELEDNLLWVVEEIPTLVMGADQTQILRDGECRDVVLLDRAKTMGVLVAFC